MTDPLSSISGLSSGIDFKSLVDQIITLDRRPAVRLQAQIDLNAKRKDAFEQFRTAVNAVKTAAAALQSGTAFDAYSSTSTGANASGTNVLAAAATAGATPGSYSVQVTSLAQAQKTIGSVAQTSSSTALGLTGTLVLNGQNIVVGAADTLTTIRDKFNAVSGTSNVQATILSVTPTDQRLVLTGLKTGAANAFTVTDDPANSPSLVAALGLNAAPQTLAGDAAFTVDGVPMTRSSNTVTDAIGNVTLTLGAVGTSAVTVERLKSAATGGVQTFVDAYNKLQAFIKTQTTTTDAPLGRDTIVRGMRGSLTDTIFTASATSPVDLATLSDVGISVAKDGTLAFDSTKFGTAYDTRLTDLKGMLADRMGALNTLTDATTAPITGQIDTREAAMSLQDSSLQSHIDDIASRLDKKRTAMLAQYARFEATIGRLKSIGDSMGTQFAGLNKSNSDN